MAAFKNKEDGTWYVQFRYTDWKGERQQKLKRGFATKKEAQAWEREFLMEKQADINMTFESFVALYEKDIKPKLKLNTWLTKESIIQKKILPYFRKRKLSEITAKDIIDWQNKIRGLTDCHGKPLSKTYLKTTTSLVPSLTTLSATTACKSIQRSGREIWVRKNGKKCCSGHGMSTSNSPRP